MHPFRENLHNFQYIAYWIQKGWKNKFETLIGKEITEKEWKKMGYTSVYVIAIKEKVILNFEVTDRLPTTAALILLLKNIGAPLLID